jgi:hypothetical protein
MNVVPLAVAAPTTDPTRVVTSHSARPTAVAFSLPPALGAADARHCGVSSQLYSELTRVCHLVWGGRLRWCVRLAYQPLTGSWRAAL